MLSNIHTGKCYTKDYLKDKLEAVETTIASNEEYKKNLLKYLSKIDETIEDINQRIIKKKQTRDLKRKMGLNDILGNIDFYKFDKTPHIPNKTLSLLRQLSHRRSNNKQLSERRLMSNISTSNSSSDAESEGDNFMLRMKKENDDSIDFENFDDEDDPSEEVNSVLGKRRIQSFGTSNIKIQQPEKSENPPSKIQKVQDYTQSEQDGKLEELEKLERKQKESGGFHSEFVGVLNNIILEYKMSPENIRSFNLVDIATKKNTCRHLTKVQIPIFGLNIYSEFRKWFRLGNPESMRWTPEEDKKLVDLVEIFGTKKWKQISSYLDGKKACMCYHRWFKHVSPTRQKQKWDDPLDDALLALGVMSFRKNNGKLRWVKVADLFEGRRTDIQCRERFVNILDPEIEVQEEDGVLEKVRVLYEEHGGKWSLIAKLIKTKTDNQIKRLVEKKILGVRNRETEKSGEFSNKSEENATE